MLDLKRRSEVQPQQLGIGRSSATTTPSEPRALHDRGFLAGVESHLLVMQNTNIWLRTPSGLVRAEGPSLKNLLGEAFLQSRHSDKDSSSHQGDQHFHHENTVTVRPWSRGWSAVVQR
jgi:hypothetical protein